MGKQTETRVQRGRGMRQKGVFAEEGLLLTRTLTRRVAQAWLSRLSALLLALVVMVSLNSCGRLFEFMGRPYVSIYAYTADGNYFVGDRCDLKLREVAVFLTSMGMSLPPDFSEAIWHAISYPPSVQEFQIFATDQPGVSVVFDDGTRPDSVVLDIYVRTSFGYDVAGFFVLDEMEEGMIYSDIGPRTAEEFWEYPKRNFGC